MKHVSSLVIALVMALGAAAVARAQAPAAPPAAAPAGPASGLQRIAFIDVQRVLARSAAGVAAREQLEKDKAGMQKEMDAKRLEIDKRPEALEKNSALLTADARREKEGTLERKPPESTQLADDFQRELARKEP